MRVQPSSILHFVESEGLESRALFFDGLIKLYSLFNIFNERLEGCIGLILVKNI